MAMTLVQRIAAARTARARNAAGPAKGSGQVLAAGPGPSVQPAPAAVPVAAAARAKPKGKAKPKAKPKAKAKPKPTQKQLDNANPLYDPTRQLSGASLRGAAKDLVNLEFAPQRSALSRELSNTTTQGTALAGRAGGYSQQLAQADAGLVPQVQAIGQLLGQKLGENTTAATAGINEALAGTQQRASADAALRGINLPGQTEGASAEAQRQRDTLALLSKSSADNAAGTTANYSGLAALSASSRAQMGNEVQGQLLTRLANQQGDVRARQADLARQEGPALSAKTGELRQQGFENLVTQAGLDIKTKDLQAQTKEGQDRIKLEKQRLAETKKSRLQRGRIAAADRRQRAAADRAARQGKASDINSYGYPNGEWRRMSTSQRQKAISDYDRQKTRDTTRPRAPKAVAPAKRKPMSQKAVDTRTGIDNALLSIQNDPKLQPLTFKPGPDLPRALQRRGAPPLVAQAATEIARYGVLRPTTIAALKRAGIRVPQSWIGTPATGRDLQPG